MEGLAEDLYRHECELLAVDIYEYHGVCSSGPAEMGQTYVVTHAIDKGEHRLPLDDFLLVNKIKPIMKLIIYTHHFISKEVLLDSSYNT